VINVFSSVYERTDGSWLWENLEMGVLKDRETNQVIKGWELPVDP
jgi:hypothetical protein